ncbi:hypothetical protein O987_06980 [Comamonas testosteroni TK102]|uniref:Uncharacterized protein n=1 Tax=Comamonas testosteroni TK102 TaxID=1392005 RepID=A0A076PFK2_COMTE|nr:hypothetical protein [Comamonas testosteroni]AIJ45539.1 hypothetical protein O987_06980 [Comamonas testosteroni TK102]
MTASIIIWAPQGSGLGDVMTDKLRKHFGLTRIYEREVFEHQTVSLPANDHLIVARSHSAPLSKIRTISFANALKMMQGGTQTLPDGVRRPGIQKLAQQIQREHPKWTASRCLVEAKVLWTNKSMNGGAA